MNNNTIESIEWHKEQLAKLLSDEIGFYKVESELDSILEKAKMKKKVKVTRKGKTFYREQEVGRKEEEKSFYRGTDLQRRFDAEEVKPDTLDYAKAIVFSRVDKMRGNNKKYAMAYIDHVEGNVDKPEFLDYNISSKAAINVRNLVNTYGNKLTGKKPSFGII